MPFYHFDRFVLEVLLTVAESFPQLAAKVLQPLLPQLTAWAMTNSVAAEDQGVPDSLAQLLPLLLEVLHERPHRRTHQQQQLAAGGAAEPLAVGMQRQASGTPVAAEAAEAAGGADPSRLGAPDLRVGYSAAEWREWQAAVASIPVGTALPSVEPSEPSSGGTGGMSLAAAETAPPLSALRGMLGDGLWQSAQAACVAATTLLARRLVTRLLHLKPSAGRTGASQRWVFGL